MLPKNQPPKWEPRALLVDFRSESTTHGFEDIVADAERQALQAQQAMKLAGSSAGNRRQRTCRWPGSEFSPFCVFWVKLLMFFFLTMICGIISISDNKQTVLFNTRGALFPHGHGSLSRVAVHGYILKTGEASFSPMLGSELLDLMDMGSSQDSVALRIQSNNERRTSQSRS